MTAWRELLNALTTVFRWWFIVQPWEQGVRVRAGKHTRVYAAGWFWMVPFVDRVYIQNTRRRLTAIPASTLSTLDGRSITIAGALGYRIDDSLKLQQTLDHAEETLRLIVSGLVSAFVVSHRLESCTAPELLRDVSSKLDLARYGLADAEYCLTDFAVVRTFRLIEGHAGHWVTGSVLDTNRTFDQQRANP
jgi:hypothetical protein